MSAAPLQPNLLTSADRVFISLSILCLLLISLPVLVTALGAPGVFASQLRSYCGVAVKAWIVFGNLLIYFAWLLTIPTLTALLIRGLPRWLSKPVVMVVLGLSFNYLLADLYVFSHFGVHINVQLLSLCFNLDFSDVLSLNHYDGVKLLSVFVLATSLPLMLSWFASRIVTDKRWALLARFTATGLRVSIWTWGLSVWGAYWLLNQTTSHRNNIFSQQLNYYPLAFQAYMAVAPTNIRHWLKQYDGNFLDLPPHDLAASVKGFSKAHIPSQPFNIVLLVIDSLRADAITAEATPHLAEFGQRALRFNHHFSGGNATQPGLFTLFYGLPPNLWQSMRHAQQPPLLIQRLMALGYQIKVLWATSMRHPDVTHTLYAHLPNLRLDHASGDDPLRWDGAITDEAIDFIRHHDKTKPYFLHLFYHSLHAFCRTRLAPQYFKPTLTSCNQLNPQRQPDRQRWRNRYSNVARALDQRIAPLLSSLQASADWANTVVIITSDHGQAFNDDGRSQWGHASDYSDYQLHVPLLIHWPGYQPGDYQYTTSHYDVSPTLLRRLLGIDQAEHSMSLGMDLFNEKQRGLLIAGSYADLAVISPGVITVIKPYGQIQQFDHRYRPLAGPLDPHILADAVAQTYQFLR